MEPNPRNEIRLTTKSLGIADSKEEDLGGYVLSQRDIISAATKILMTVGIAAEDIRTIMVGSDKNGQLRIICEVKYKAAFKKSQNNTEWCSFTDGSDDNDVKNAFDKNFYMALYNKVYHGKRKHLDIKIVHRPDGKDMKKYVSFEFDPYIFIAFVYNIVFTDPFYKISAPAIGWMSPKKINRLPANKRKKYIATKREYTNAKLANCAIYVTFGKNSKYTLTSADDKQTVITGFHPAQVDEFYDNQD